MNLDRSKNCIFAFAKIDATNKQLDTKNNFVIASKTLAKRKVLKLNTTVHVKAN